jgi:hypothetical protein
MVVTVAMVQQVIMRMVHLVYIMAVVAGVGRIKMYAVTLV